MKVIAIIVLYNPERGKVIKKLKSVAYQVDKLCLIDNSSDSNIYLIDEFPEAIYYPQFHNLGIAAAQNVGLKYAMKHQYDFVLFSDPDSAVPDQAVKNLMDTYQRLTISGYHVGAVGSTAYSESTNLPYHIKDCFIRKINNQRVTEVSYTMNSISIIPLELFHRVGLMDESLFIDGVDDEWCWRATSQLGCRFFLDDNVIIKHNLGKSGGKIGNKTISIASPQRLYYEYRNYLWLRRRDYVPRHWINYNGWKYFVKLFCYPLFVSPRVSNLTNIIRGIKDGLVKGNDSAKF